MSNKISDEGAGKQELTNKDRSSFLTAEQIQANPILEVAGIFAGEPYWEELMEEIKKERAKQRRRNLRQVK